jgi:hypothetical protein
MWKGFRQIDTNVGHLTLFEIRCRLQLVLTEFRPLNVTGIDPFYKLLQELNARRLC